jgi:hypothetical protein
MQPSIPHVVGVDFLNVEYFRQHRWIFCPVCNAQRCEQDPSSMFLFVGKSLLEVAIYSKLLEKCRRM